MRKPERREWTGNKRDKETLGSISLEYSRHVIIHANIYIHRYTFRYSMTINKDEASRRRTSVHVLLCYSLEIVGLDPCSYFLGVRYTPSGGFAHRLNTFWPLIQSLLSGASFRSKLKISRAMIVRISAYARLRYRQDSQFMAQTVAPMIGEG